MVEFLKMERFVAIFAFLLCLILAGGRLKIIRMFTIWQNALPFKRKVEKALKREILGKISHGNSVLY